MWEWLEQLFGGGFMPHGHCYLWSPAMVSTQVGSNLLIGLAYASIAATLAVLVRRIRNMPFAWVYYAFGIFILSCGLTHWIDIVTVWHPIYWADAGVRVLTAVASVATALLILPLVPRAVALAETARLSDERKVKLESTLAELEVANRQLEDVARDARRRAETSEEQLRSFVESMPQLAWISAPDGENRYRNNRWAEYTGVPLEELAKVGWGAVHDPELLPEVTRSWTQALTTGSTFDIECRLRRADGELRWFLARAVPFRDKSGAIDAWLGTLTDIHEQRMLREAALRTARMKDEFVATVSHELRTPLNAMLGWSRMLRSGAVPEGTRGKALETIERNAVAQTQLIDDLLDVSRIISGKMRLDIAVIDPAAAVRAALEAVAPAAAAKSVTIELELEPGAGPLNADAGRIQQIVWNLLSNAVKFTSGGGRVTVALARADAQVIITVTDSGAGISAEFLPFVFDRFSQEDGSISRKNGGLGIGLAIVKHLVELHGGTIRAESEGVGRGAVFTVRLPLAGAKESEPPPRLLQREATPERLRPPGLRGLRVLLVEDEADSSDLVRAILEDCGSEVVCVSTAEEALQAIDGARAAMLISDIGLPGKSGYELVEQLRRNPAYASLPALALTAYAGADDRKRALAAGYQMHVAKPIEPSELVATVAALVRLAAGARA